MQLEGALARAELVGSVRGAYTGADRDRLGLIRMADGGTLVIDDADDLPASAQLWLLEIAEHEELRPVGSDRCFLPNIRLVVCFQTAPEVLVQEKRLRPDLLHRIDQERIVLRPLSERLEDIPDLARAALAEQAARREESVPSLSKEAVRLLTNYSWPGNVRELLSAVEKAYRRARRGEAAGARLRIGAGDLAFLFPALPPRLRGRGPRLAADDIRAALKACGNSVTRTAELCGIPERTLWRRVKAHGIDLGASEA